jgi:hypothetical protein
MRILVADGISNRSFNFELGMFSQRADVDFLDLGLRLEQNDRVACTPWREVVRRIRGGTYGAAFIGKPVCLWNPRKAFWRNAWWLARRSSLGLQPFRLRPLLSLLKAANVPIAGVDTSDTPVIDNSRFPIFAASQIFFKRELPTNATQSFLYTSDRAEDLGNIMRIPFFGNGLHKLRPVSLGVSDARFEQLAAFHPDKDIDVFFAGTITNRAGRQTGLRELQRLEREGFRVVATGTKFTDKEYQALAARALICWSPEGFGFDCFRTYEVAALGSVPLLKTPPILAHAGFHAGVDALLYTHEALDLYTVLKTWLAEPAKLAEMGRRARERVRTHHRDSALAFYMQKTLLGSGDDGDLVLP